MQTALGVDVAATLVAPSVLPVANMGARIEVPYTRAIVAYYRLAAYDPVAGRWAVVLDAPPALGEYNLVWRTDDPEPPELEVFIPLSVTSATAATAVPAPGSVYPWAPTVEQVAEVVPAYTRGGFDDDRFSAGAEQVNDNRPTFTDDTSPTRTHVEGLIQAACDEVSGRVGVAIPVARYGLAQAAARWHVAAMIAAGKTPTGTDDVSGDYRANITNFRASLDELIVLARSGWTRLA